MGRIVGSTESNQLEEESAGSVGGVGTASLDQAQPPAPTPLTPLPLLSISPSTLLHTASAAVLRPPSPRPSPGSHAPRARCLLGELRLLLPHLSGAVEAVHTCGQV